MSLTSIAEEIKDAVGQGSAWLAKAIETHVPALLTEAQRVEASPVYQVIAGLVLPPEVEQEIANVVTAMVRLSGVKPAAPAEPVAAEPAEPEAPASA